MIEIVVYDKEELIDLSAEGELEAYISEGLQQLGIDNFKLEFTS